MKTIREHKWIILILVLATIIRLKSIGQSIWLDEGTTALVTAMSFQEFFGDFVVGDFHPPLYYLLAKYWSGVFGISEIALRGISLISGVGTVFFVYLIGRKFNKKVGLLSALFISLSGLHVYYSQEARMYALATFLATASVYFFMQILKKPNKWDWIIFGLSMAFLSMTHYLTVFLIDAFWLYALIKKMKWSWWKKFMLSHIFLILAWLCWFPHFYKQLTAGLGVQSAQPNWWNILGKTTPKEIFLVPTKFILGRISIDDNKIYALVAGSVIALYTFIISRGINLKKGILKFIRSDRGFVWFWLAIPFLEAMIIGLFIPVFGYFRLLFILPALFILLALGIDSLTKKNAKVFTLAVVVVSLVSTGIYLFNPKFQREDWKGLVAYVSAKSTNNSAVLFVNNSQMEAYEYYLSGIVYYKERCFNCQETIVPPLSPEEFDGRYDTVWLMRYVQPVFDAEDDTRNMIEELGYKKEREYDFNGIVVWKYDR